MVKIRPFLFLITIIVLNTQVTDGQIYALIGNIITSLINLTGIQPFLFPLYPDKQLEILFHQNWDFIIIGSSPSGIALASRLTKNPDVTVLLLEAGEEGSLITDIPIAVGALGSSQYEYGYTTEPQAGYCRACSNNKLKWERGKALGGSTIINYMIYVRGNQEDYNRWSNTENSGWSYNELLPYFKKIEDTHVNISDTDYRGVGGYLYVADVPWRSKLSGIYIKAAQESGLDYVDYNGRQQIGVSYVQATIKDGLRFSAEKAYLRPVRDRSNLVVQTKSEVTEILIKNKTAYGVKYVHNGITFQALANKEVILSAGALNSPKLLMLSGIGPKEELEQYGIPVKQELPVGKKVYDHATFPLIVYQLNDSVSVGTADMLNPLNPIELAQGKGLFTSPGGVEAITFVKTSLSTDPDPFYPDIELLVLAGAVSNDNGIVFRNIYNIPPLVYDTIFKPLEGKYVYQATPTLLHPLSYGSVKLRSSNPQDPPLLYANYFSDPENHDVRTLIAGIREFQKINSSPSLQKVGATLVTTPVPGCESVTFDSDEYWECAIRAVIGSYFHMVATCKMGNFNDIEAVVDYNLKVYGIDRLRVVDTSIIPAPPSCHTMSPGYVIGEKAADIIKDYWKI